MAQLKEENLEDKEDSLASKLEEEDEQFDKPDVSEESLEETEPKLGEKEDSVESELEEAKEWAASKPTSHHSSDIEPEEELSTKETDLDSVGAEFAPIKRPPLSQEIDPENRTHPSLNIRQPFTHKKSSNKTTILLIVLLLLILAGGGFFLLKGKNPVSNLLSTSSPTPSPTSTPSPTEAPKTLEKSQWSLEVLNGSGKSGYAKEIADKIKELGYPVTKVGNADNQNYAKTQILVKNSLIDKTDLVIADLKDVLKVASFGGELKEGTASARIIIGKDAI